MNNKESFAQALIAELDVPEAPTLVEKESIKKQTEETRPLESVGPIISAEPYEELTEQDPDLPGLLRTRW